MNLLLFSNFFFKCKSGEHLKSGSYLVDIFTQLVRHCLFFTVSTFKEKKIYKERRICLHHYTKFLFSKRMGNLKTNGKMTFKKEYSILILSYSSEGSPALAIFRHH
jgi:hypothetical protein